MKFALFTGRINVPCTPELKILIEQVANQEREPMTTVARRWLTDGAKKQLGDGYVEDILQGKIPEGVN